MIKQVLRVLLRCYQYTLSPYLGNCCRFHPTCSNYALEALKNHTLAYALFLITKRLFSCHPWHRGGYDPVPLVSKQLGCADIEEPSKK